MKFMSTSILNRLSKRNKPNKTGKIIQLMTCEAQFNVNQINKLLIKNFTIYHFFGKVS